MQDCIPNGGAVAANKPVHASDAIQRYTVVIPEGFHHAVELTVGADGKLTHPAD
ncbi:hypothetical protein OD795_15995 [Pseudomonas aeruginosa]|nr:hypothetical protein [Pseudomonas aeruginosa]MCV4221644.1 hypothetical protein [Pseudomonas aeruginosa]